MYENQNKHYAINVFSERNVRNVIFCFLFTRLGKGRGNPNWFPFEYVRFITETLQIFVTAPHSKYRPVRNETSLSLWWTNSVARGNNRKLPILFYFWFHNTLSAKCQGRKL